MPFTTSGLNPRLPPPDAIVSTESQLHLWLVHHGKERAVVSDQPDGVILVPRVWLVGDSARDDELKQLGRPAERKCNKRRRFSSNV
eukprot:scaffold5807_cov212-Skeletonema_menzelii.AAC.1